MKQKSITVYSIIISTVFAAAIVFFCWRLGYEYVAGSDRTKAQFSNLKDSTRTALLLYEPSSAEFKKAFEKACGNYEDYAFITLKDSTHVLFTYPTQADTATAVRFCEPYTYSFSTGDASYILSASLYLIRPSSVFYYARFTFLIILIATAFTILLIIYVHFSSSNAMHVQNELFEDETLLEDTYAENDFASSSKPALLEKPMAEGNEAAPSPYSLATFEETAPQPQNETEKTATPQGLFSPATGLSWEQYLEVRLDSELIRAASSEQDLSLFLLRVPLLSLADSIALCISTYLSEQFQYNDLLFEYKSDGFAIIKENTAIDEAISIAETMHAAVSKLLKEENASLACAIGISARSVRMLPGKRLLKEAEEALENALDSPENPIVAFRVNADKYRQIIGKEQ